jgi:plasmid maintenance system antidote protein VapI
MRYITRNFKAGIKVLPKEQLTPEERIYITDTCYSRCYTIYSAWVTRRNLRSELDCSDDIRNDFWIRFQENFDRFDKSRISDEWIQKEGKLKAYENQFTHAFQLYLRTIQQCILKGRCGVSDVFDISEAIEETTPMNCESIDNKLICDELGIGLSDLRERYSTEWFRANYKPNLNHIRNVIKKEELNLAELSQYAKVTGNILTRMLNGSTEIPHKLIRKIASQAGISPYQLYYKLEQKL